MAGLSAPQESHPFVEDQIASPAPIATARAAREPLREGRTSRSDNIKLAGLEGIVGLHLGIGHSLVVQPRDHKLKALGLTAKQVTIMWLVEANPAITQIEIGRFLAIERSTIHQFTRSLVKNGMIRVVQSETDGRSSRIELTDKGRDSLARARKVIIAHEAENTAQLTPIERRLLLDLLFKLGGAMTSG